MPAIPIWKAPHIHRRQIVGETLVSREDYLFLSAWKWKLCEQGYVYRLIDTHKRVYMHTEVFKRKFGRPPLIKEPDHADRNKLNNQRSNIRIATPAQQQVNQGVRTTSRSGLKGVRKSGYRWSARIRVNGKYKTLGSYSDPVLAAKAFDKAARELHGEFAYTNYRE